ncbi:DUF3168 domain-containing protein [Chitinophaga sp. Hz27]|uniref:tail completion protein gp17 n=1 Tax=Chitinophaga sp. Hz27 TaxID=3347169 RepID=UPI0035D84B72
MGSPKAILRKGYIDKLSGAVVSGKTIPVYDLFAQDDALDAYIVIGSYNSTELRTKCKDDHNPSVTVEVYTKFKKQGGSLLADQIADMVIDRIKANNLDLSPNFILLSTQLLSDNDLQGFDTDYKVYRRILRFGHIIQTLN